ncbi:MAG: SWIM zinc finger family protein, partial [Nocardioidaceae bacterium]
AVAAAGARGGPARPPRGAVCRAGPARLEVLGPLLRFATALRVYGPATEGAPVASAWELTLPDARLTLTLSPDLSRGFSGEGGVLTSLVDEQVDDDAETVAAALAWRPRIDVDDLADRAGLAPDRVLAALVRLGIAGRVGYDPAEAAYFHRELPYDAAGAERLNPRLRAARRLVDEGRVRVGGAVLVVRGDDHDQHVRRTDEGLTCTCPWWARYAGTRGPCKHVLAAQMVLG